MSLCSPPSDLRRTLDGGPHASRAQNGHVGAGLAPALRPRVPPEYRCAHTSPRVWEEVGMSFPELGILGFPQFTPDETPAEILSTRQ